MNRHSLIVRLNRANKSKITVADKFSKVSTIHFMSADKRLGHGIGQMLEQLMQRGMNPSETAIDLAILAAAVTAADTKISRRYDTQDSWTREIDLYLPVSNVDLWSENAQLLERMLQFLTGDFWRVMFRSREKGMRSLIGRQPQMFNTNFDAVCLFSGGLDSFVGATDLLEDGKNPIFVSHYKDASTAKQVKCASKLCKQYVEFDQHQNHVLANVSFNRNDLPELDTETTTRGRSFVFFALAALAADAIDGTTLIHVPENGLISINVPLDPLRIGAWSTRTTHPFYMARWQELLDNLGIDALLFNPYRFKTKGEMLAGSSNSSFIAKNYEITISCSSVTKSRWKGLSPSHCGYCVPCLIRRASIETAFGKDTTTYTTPNLDARPLNARNAESTDVRSIQLMYRRLRKNPNVANVLVHKAGPLNDYSLSEISEYANVFKRGIEEVGELVKNVRIS